MDTWCAVDSIVVLGPVSPLLFVDAVAPEDVVGRSGKAATRRGWCDEAGRRDPILEAGADPFVAGTASASTLLGLPSKPSKGPFAGAPVEVDCIFFDRRRGRLVLFAAP